MNIKAVIFDCFNVLVGDSLNKFVATYFAGNPDGAHTVFELDRQASRGELTYDEYLAESAKLAGISAQGAKDFLSNNPPNEPLLDYIARDLKPKYKIGFISNASDDWMDELFTPEQQALFDDVILSFQHGISKPDPAIFKLSAEHLGANPSECIFIDDIKKYVEGAQAVGMAAIQYESFDQLKPQLERLLGSAS